MKKIVFLFILTLRFTWATAQNFAAVHKFFELTNTLQSGRSLTDSAWKTFLETEGNRYFIESNGVPPEYTDRVRKACELVFMPGNDSLVDSLRATDQFINNYYQVKLNLDSLKAYTQRLQSVNFVDTIYARAVEWLPRRMHTFKIKPRIFYQLIDFNGSANNPYILPTIWGSYRLDAIKPGAYSGHEMHHFLRTSIPLKPVAEKDKGIMWALESVLTEGTADMVDMRYWQMTAELKEYIKEMALAAPGMLIKLGTSLEAMYKVKKAADRNYYRDLFQGSGGHTPGYFMATIIEKNGYKKEMLDHCDDPFQFAYIYNKAARKDKHAPVFSATAIRQLKLLEKRYKL